jgi:hypothetical protein
MSELTCTGTPVSWLRLERLALGELPGDEARLVEAHLGECAACRACAEECREPVALLPLELGVARTVSVATAASASDALPVDQRLLATVVRHPRVQPRSRWVLPLALGLAAAAALALAFLPDNAEEPVRGITRVGPLDVPPETVGATDAAAHRNDPTLTLLRERNGAVVEDAPNFLVSDRFAIQLTCRPGQEGQQRVAVYQSGEWSLPLTDEGERCGNRVRVPGAFRLSEASPAEICVLWGETALKASTASAELPAPSALTEATCRRVEPVAPPALR